MLGTRAPTAAVGHAMYCKVMGARERALYAEICRWNQAIGEEENCHVDGRMRFGFSALRAGSRG